MLMVPAEVYDIIADRMEKAGIYVLLKPVNKTVLLCVLRFAIVTQKRIRAMRMRNRSLKDRLSEIKVIDRAKCLLMEHEQLSEAQAHRYLEKRAMDSQMSRLQVAEQLLKNISCPDCKESDAKAALHFLHMQGSCSIAIKGNNRKRKVIYE